VIASIAIKDLFLIPATLTAMLVFQYEGQVDWGSRNGCEQAPSTAARHSGGTKWL
jgi:hypothetical protein